MKDLKVHISGGTGKMGSFLQHFLMQEGLYVSVSGRIPAKDQIREANLNFVCVPISKSEDTIMSVSEMARDDSVVIDLSSVMHLPQRAFEKIPQNSFSMHFLFGPNVPSLQGQTVIIQAKKLPKPADVLMKIINKSGAKIVYMSPVEHDRLMAFIQNLTHFINISFAEMVIQDNILKKSIMTPVFLAQLSSAIKVITQDASLLSEIQKNNPYGKQEIEKYLSLCTSLYEEMQNQDEKKLKNRILESQKHFLPKQKMKRMHPENERFILKSQAKVGYLGPEGTYSFQAAQLLKKGLLVPFKSVSGVFQNVAKKNVSYGIVPAQNTIEGAVRETFDNLAILPVKTLSSVYLPIHHSLLSNASKLQDISDVYSHPQALSQCKHFLSAHLQNAAIHESASTVSEISQYSGNRSVAFIAPEAAGKLYNLPILQKNIEDKNNNTTRFFVISHADTKINYTGNKTLLFLSVYNRVGVLRDILTIFANENINLLNIESRPSRNKSWDYNFFIELEISPDSPKLTESINLLRQYCPEIKILGGVT